MVEKIDWFGTLTRRVNAQSEWSVWPSVWNLESSQKSNLFQKNESGRSALLKVNLRKRRIDISLGSCRCAMEEDFMHVLFTLSSAKVLKKAGCWGMLEGCFTLQPDSTIFDIIAICHWELFEWNRWFGASRYGITVHPNHRGGIGSQKSKFWSIFVKLSNQQGSKIIKTTS